MIIPHKQTEATTPSQKVTEPAPQQTTKEDNILKEEAQRCKTEHIVKRKENIYRISRIYGLSELELINANPELRKRKLKQGETLCIPYAKTEQQAEKPTPKEEEKAPIITIPSNEELFAESKEHDKEDIEQIKAAIILPFMLDKDSITSDQAKMVEFYEGALLALDSLKGEGVSIDLHVYDSGDNDTSISPILSSPEMRKMNIIFGPVYSRHISEATAFADTTGIRVVIPFDRNVDAVFNNPYVYQVNTPQSYFYSEVYDHFFRQFPRPNVIFFESPE